MKRFILASALIVTLSAISLANAPDVRFASGRSALNIPFKLVKNHIYLQVSINDSKPLWFLLDTGANNLINLRHAGALGLKLNPAGQTTGMGEGLADFFTVENVSFSLPGVSVGPQKFAVLSLEGAEECSKKIDVDAQGQITVRTKAASEQEEQMDGVLGTDFFMLFVVEIDYVTKTINLHDPAKYRYEGNGEKIPLEIRQKYIFARAPVTASTHSALDGLYIIDSGSAVALILNSPFVEQNKLLPPPDRTTPFQICGIGGESQTQIGKVGELRLENIRVQNPITLFSQAKNGQLARSDFSGNIGNAILRHFKVIFDYSRRVMILEPVKHRD